MVFQRSEDTMPSHCTICVWSLVLAVAAMCVALGIRTQAAAAEFGPAASAAIAANSPVIGEDRLQRFGFLEFEGDGGIPGFGPLD